MRVRQWTKKTYCNTDYPQHGFGNLLFVRFIFNDGLKMIRVLQSDRLRAVEKVSREKLRDQLVCKRVLLVQFCLQGNSMIHFSNALTIESSGLATYLYITWIDVLQIRTKQRHSLSTSALLEFIYCCENLIDCFLDAAAKDC